jgi:MerR family transcriptional regulator, repressor of the yfmOP operon
MVATETEDAGAQEQALYTIEQVATRTGLTKRTLRYYEEVGLLPPTGRTEGNYRRYSEADLQQLERIMNLRDLLGFSLNDIRELLKVEEERGTIKVAYRQETDVATKIAQLDRSDDLIRAELHMVLQKIAGLEQMRDTLNTKLARHEQARNDLLQAT